MKAGALAALLLAAGCACSIDHVDLEDRWRPLKRVQRDPGTPAGVYRAVGELVLTGDPCEFVLRSR